MAMKIFFLFITLLFSASVLADCCNFEIETSFDQCQAIDSADDHCGDSSGPHSEPEHCHCSPINHLRILSASTFVISLPPSFGIELISTPDSLFNSLYEASIFHPPIV